jgi:sulfate adenylyltransferase subunit 2
LRERRYRSHDCRLSQLDALEAEAVHIFREVVAELERPVLLFSGGKDSIVMLRLAEKAFWPARIPFPVMHVDTGHNFDEVLAFRDRRVAELGVQLIVASVPEALESGLVSEPPDGTRNRIQTPVLLDALERHGFTAAFGGARRDEDKARAKERVFSFRDDFGQWESEEPAAPGVSGPLTTTAHCGRSSQWPGLRRQVTRQRTELRRRGR